MYVPVRMPCDFGICHRCNGKSATFYEHPMEDSETIYMACDECWAEHDKQFEVSK